MNRNQMTEVLRDGIESQREEITTSISEPTSPRCNNINSSLAIEIDGTRAMNIRVFDDHINITIEHAFQTYALGHASFHRRQDGTINVQGAIKRINIYLDTCLRVHDNRAEKLNETIDNERRIIADLRMWDFEVEERLEEYHTRRTNYISTPTARIAVNSLFGGAADIKWTKDGMHDPNGMTMENVPVERVAILVKTVDDWSKT